MSSNLDFVKLQDQYFDDEQKLEQEESLSLCDLPITEIVTPSVKEPSTEVENLENAINVEDSSFDFGLLIGSVDELGFEMCSADEVFSGGQILPFRHSVSSECGLSKTVNSNSNYQSISRSRSESTDRSGVCSRSSSTRSNSIRSQYSSTSSTSTSSNNTSVKSFPISKTRGRNNFHSHPSPRPQVWATGAHVRGPTPNYTTQISKKSTMWEVLRLGLVRAPEIELQDLKQRNRMSTSRNTTTFVVPRNSSSSDCTNISSNRKSNNNNNNNNNNNRKMSELLVELNKKKSGNNGGLFKSCKCSVLAIEPIPARQYGTKSNYFGTKISNGPKSSSSKFSTNYVHLVKEDKELEEKKVRVQEEKKQMKRQVKKVMSHHYRTFEWLRDLSHANVLNS